MFEGYYALFLKNNQFLAIYNDLKGPSMSILLFGLLIFLGVHLVSSLSTLRTRILAGIGESGYKSLHSIAAIVGLTAIIYGFVLARRDDYLPLYIPPFWLSHLALLFLLPIFVLVFSAFFPGNITKYTKHLWCWQ